MMDVISIYFMSFYVILSHFQAFLMALKNMISHQLHPAFATRGMQKSASEATFPSDGGSISTRKKKQTCNDKCYQRNSLKC